MNFDLELNNNVYNFEFSLSLSLASSFFRKLFYMVPSVGLFFWSPSIAYILHYVQSYKVEHGIESSKQQYSVVLMPLG